MRWRALLRGLIAGRAKGVVVDLRGCRAIDDHCLGALLATGATMKVGGGSGVALVTTPGSVFSEELRQYADGEMPSYGSAQAALLALGAT
jgi:anti-anti-sigma regulatory factor